MLHNACIAAPLHTPLMHLWCTKTNMRAFAVTLLNLFQLVLAWPLTLTCLRCAHMLALYLQWRLFLIILHNVAAVINSPEFEGETCPNQGSCLTSLDSFQENAETRVEIMVQQYIKCRKNICGSQNCDYSGKICCEKHNFVCETPVLPLGFNV